MKTLNPNSVDLSIDFAGVHFLNPFTLAASPCTDSTEMVSRAFEAGWGAAVLKTTSTEAEEVSIAYPIMSSLNRGNRMIGLHNIDLISEWHIDTVTKTVRELKKLHPQHVVIGSIVGNSKAEWQALARQMADAGADMLELSVSCPQGSMIEGEDEPPMGFMVSQDPRLTQKVTEWVKEAVPNTPAYVKLTSGVTDLVMMVQAVEAGGADGVCVIDSVEGVVGINLETLEPYPSVGGYASYGGYTGRAIKPIALRCVTDAAGASELPIAGVGGIYDWRDVAEFFLLGARTVQVCTAAMELGFGIVEELSDGLSRWMARKGYGRLDDIIGLSRPRLVEHDDLPHDIKVRANIDLEKCIGCGRCHVACRDGGHQAIVWNEERQPYVDEEKCVGCSLCPQVCPVLGCISMRVLA